MDLISLVVVLIIVGVLLWLVNSYLPMDARIKRILNGSVWLKRDANQVKLWLKRHHYPAGLDWS